MGRQKRGKKSGTRKVGRGKWGAKRLMLDEKSGGEKTGTRKVRREKEDEKSGGEKSETR